MTTGLARPALARSVEPLGLPDLGTHMAVLGGDIARRRFVAGFTRPAVQGPPTLVGAIAMDSPCTLLHLRDHIGAPLPEHRLAG
jgi:hypothetical protein